MESKGPSIIRKMLIHKPKENIVVFSESPEGRDYWRNRGAQFGFNAVCFEKEAICFDNFKSIAPKIVIAQSEANQIIWRFIFAAHAMRLDSPLLIVSESLKAGNSLRHHTGLPLDVVAALSEKDSPVKMISGHQNGFQCFRIRHRLPLFVGETAAIRKIRSQLPSIAASWDPVLITGDKGTGKELLVRLIHGMAAHERHLVKIDCSELQPEMMINGLLDALLAARTESGPATLFFDNIHLVPKEIQSEVLLVIDRLDNRLDRQKTALPWHARIIATCEPVIQERLKADRFRKDLYYRLNVIPIQIPPLRNRKDDISMLMDYFLIKACTDSRKSIMIPSSKARDALYLYHWPGNVGELKTYMQRVAAAGNESCVLENYRIPKPRKNTSEYFLKAAGSDELPKVHEIKNSLTDLRDISLRKVCEAFVSRTEKKLMQKALETTNWNRKKAAQLLNISYKSMLNKMKAYDIM